MKVARTTCCPGARARYRERTGGHRNRVSPADLLFAWNVSTRTRATSSPGHPYAERPSNGSSLPLFSPSSVPLRSSVRNCVCPPRALTPRPAAGYPLHDEQNRRHRPRHHQLSRRRHGRGLPRPHRRRRGPTPHALRRPFSRRGGIAAGRRCRQARPRSQAQGNRLLHQTLHGPARQRAFPGRNDRQLSRRREGDRAGARRAARPRLVARGNLGRNPQEAQGRRRAFPRRNRHPRGHHRPGLFQRRPAQRHQGSGPPRRI